MSDPKWRVKNAWRCLECDVVSAEDEVLTAVSPFDADDIIWGCPECKAVNRFEMLCRRIDCSEEATVGRLCSDGAYRFTCAWHAERVST